MNKTKIDWADSTWNPVTGCLHDCEYCYARDIAGRFEGVFDGGQNCKLSYSRHDHPIEVTGAEFDGLGFKYRVGNDNRGEPKLINAPYPYGFRPTMHRHRIESGLTRWKKPRTVFVGSMTDLFGEWVPDRWIEEVFTACAASPQHRYLFLTKNPARYLSMAQSGKLPANDNWWYGTTATTDTADIFFSGNHNTFVSIEPILAEFDCQRIDDGLACRQDWVIIGAETGSRKDKVVPRREWIEKIVASSKESGIPVLMKNNLKKVWESCGGCEQNENGCYGESRTLIKEFPWENGGMNRES